MEQLPTASPTSCLSTHPLLWEEAGFLDPLPPGVQAIIPAHKRWLAFWRAEDGVLLLVRVHEQAQTRVWICYHSAYDLRDTMPALAGCLPEYTLCDALLALANKLQSWPLEDASFVAFAQHTEDACALPPSLVDLLKRRMRHADESMGDVDPLYAFAVEHAQQLAEQLGFVCVPYDEGPTAADAQRLCDLEMAHEVAHSAWANAAAEAMRGLTNEVLAQFSSEVVWEQEPTLDVDDPCDRGFELSGWLRATPDAPLTDDTCTAIERALEARARRCEALRGLNVCAELGANTADEADFIEQTDGTTVFRRVDLSLRAWLAIPDPDPY